MKSKNKYLLWLLFLPLSVWAQNLLENPGAETSPVIGNGWTLVSGNITSVGCGVNPPCQEGSHLFFANQFAKSECYQIVDVSAYSITIDNGTQKFAFSDHVRSFPQSPADAARAVVEYRDSGGNILSTYDSEYHSSTTAWLLLTDTRIAPVGTRSIKVRILAKRNNGTNNDAYHDDLSLEPLAPLPVEMVDFQAIAEGNKIKLTWQTAAELDNDGFLVERTTNGQIWEKIGFVQGYGTTSEMHGYHFLDENPLLGLNYYRLRQKDFEGKEEYSGVVSFDFLNLGDFGNLRLAPNPATTQIQLMNLELSDFDYLQVTDHHGRRVLMTHDLASSLEIGHWEPGIYYLQLYGAKPTKTLRFFKN